MKTIFFTLLIGVMPFIVNNINAQQVISSTGGNGSNGSGSLSYTMGELMIDTQTSGTITLTQGFHQSKLTITAINELPGLSFFITAFPNPVHDMVTLKAEKGETEKLGYALLDFQGKLLLKGDLLNGEAKIPFSALPAATYVLKIVKDGKEMKTMKIVKQ